MSIKISNSKNVEIVYSKEHDILGVWWDNEKTQYDSSVEILDGKVVVDFDTKGDVKGFEFFDFVKEVKEGIKRTNKMMGWNKKKKKKN